MAQKLLSNLLNFKTSPSEILEWLTTDDFNKEQWADFNSSCPREEFISFFLNYLREQFISVLQSNNGSKQTPSKKILIPRQSSHSDDLIKIINQGIGTGNNLVKSSLDDQDDFKEQVKINIAEQDSIINDQAQLLKSKCKKSALYQNPTSTTSSRTSTPVTGKKNSSSKKRANLISCVPSENQHINPAFKDSVEYEHCPDRKDSINISFDDNSFPSLGGRNSNSNVSNYSQNLSNDESFDLVHSNVSTRSNTSMNNKILQSPESPLYSNSTSMLSPINSKIYPHRFHNSPSNNNLTINSPSNNNFYHITSTPENSPNNLTKRSKATPRQSLCLSDFITTDTLNSKKSSTKKAHSKSRCKNDEQNDDNTGSVISNTSTTHPEEKNKRRRKVNPTRLKMSNADIKDKENTVFGEVSRPFTQNPQFVNVPPIDKPADNDSFQLERGLVKIERQRKPEIISNTNLTDEQSQPKCKILLSTPKKSISTIIPDKTLVENIQALNLLAELYSGFLDNNLVFNPMTELYFLINLITSQYKNVKVLSITNIEQQLQHSCVESMKNCTYDKNELLASKKVLNFDDLEENDALSSNDKINNDSLCDNKSITELGCSSLIDDTDDTKKNFNLINKVLHGLDMNNDQTTNNKNDIHKNIEAIKEPDVAVDYVQLYLNSPHNCVYFSTQVLNLQKYFLKCLDRVTLKLLCGNNSMSIFQPELCKYLDSIYDIKVSEANKTKFSLNVSIVELNVCFQIDTDNFENFPSHKAFTDFKRQRDAFYEILKNWEDNHLNPKWDFGRNLDGKIKSMLMMHEDVTNFVHLTRLFKSQMLISCIQSGQQEDILDDETMSFLKNIKDMNLEKLTHLNKKLITPLSQNGPVPLPSFPGFQEFFKTFIEHTYHPMFLKHLEDTFVHEIMELNNTQFAASDIEESETEVDERTKQSFGICLSSLRLLAKFLGYLTSLSYIPKTSVPKKLMTSQIALRSKCLPQIDLHYCLNTAVVQGKLSLTVPWVVEYLSMMDYASLRLPYYKKVLEMVYCIYRISNYHAVVDSEELMTQQTTVLLKLCIGWLFELPTFPTELYYFWQAKYNHTTLKFMCENQPAIVDTEGSILSIKHSLFLDKLEMVDNRILYSCCPFLREFNILLIQGNSNVNNSISHRHVTPVTSQLQKPMKEINAKNLEIQLEEAFFHGQPMSTRKTVEYVSERVASSCVKYIYNSLLPIERQHNSVTLKSLLDEKYNGIIDQNNQNLKSTLLKEMDTLAMNASKNIKEKSDQIILKMCKTRISQSIESLLSDDCLEQVKEMCIKIATRMAVERIDQWIQSHITGGSIFIKDMEAELSKYMKESEDVVVSKKCHNFNTTGPTDILERFKEIIWDLMETRGKLVTMDVLIQFLDQLYICLTERSDINTSSEKIMASLSIDLCLSLISYRHDLFTEEVRDKLFKVYKIDCLKLSTLDSPLTRILCPRNIMLMLQSPDDAVWLNLGKFLNDMLLEDILSIDYLNEQAVALFRREWPEMILKNLSVCLERAIADYRASGEETERIRYLTKWVAGAYNDIHCDGFNLNLN
ncbi:codanin-1 [Phymastichus coffea]|uniref:codanin-1 n=1 Tax=Phymastichus coffea TaxID=108790 RepID=UPI00273AECCF|nr:codanin-1 [Phymastichus coffea]